MPFVTRYQVQDLHGRAWDGWDFTADEDAAEEFTDEADALEIALRFDAEVVEFSRFDEIGDIPRFQRKYNTLQAAE